MDEPTLARSLEELSDKEACVEDEDHALKGAIVDAFLALGSIGSEPPLCTKIPVDGVEGAFLLKNVLTAAECDRLSSAVQDMVSNKLEKLGKDEKSPYGDRRRRNSQVRRRGGARFRWRQMSSLDQRGHFKNPICFICMCVPMCDISILFYSIVVMSANLPRSTYAHSIHKQQSQLNNSQHNTPLQVLSSDLDVFSKRLLPHIPKTAGPWNKSPLR